MSLTALPSGLQPAYHPSGYIRSVAHTGILLSGTNVNILKNQPVFLGIGTGAAVNGVTVPAGQVYIAPVVSTAQAIWGVLAGVEYFDSTNTPQETNCWVANTTLFANTLATVFLWEDPAIVYTIQTDAALTTPQIDGRQANLSNFSAGSAVTGLSQCTLGVSTLVATTVQGQLQISKQDPTPFNQSSTDAFLQVQVRIARGQNAAPFVSI